MITVVVLAVALTAGPASQGTTRPRQPPSPARVDACSLLTSTEIQGVLGEAVRERQPNTQPARGLLMAQCFFGTSSARSVSVAVAAATSRGRSAVTPKQFWKQQFHPDAARPEAKADRRGTSAPRAGRGAAEAREPERGETSARIISGIGDEAFWSGTKIAGALYVLKGDRFIRISVGGIRDEAERIEKSKALAQLALPRF